MWQNFQLDMLTHSVPCQFPHGILMLLPNFLSLHNQGAFFSPSSNDGFLSIIQILIGKFLKTFLKAESIEYPRERHITSHFWLKPFCELSLSTMLFLEQVSVINSFKGKEECRNNELLSGKRSNNSKYNISPVDSQF